MINAYEADAIETAPDLSKLLRVGDPTNGNPNTGTPATLPGAAWFYMVTAELMSVLTAAEVQPDRNKVNQLLEAINKLIEAAANGVKLPTGTILPCARKTVPDGFFWCNGTNFDEEMYPGLYSFLGTNKLPDLRDRTIWGANTADDVGKYLEDGLPNVSGSFDLRKWGNNGVLVHNPAEAFSVSFTKENNIFSAADSQIQNDEQVISFNASRSSIVYGANTKVQTRSFQALMIIKA